MCVVPFDFGGLCCRTHKPTVTDHLTWASREFPTSLGCSWHRAKTCTRRGRYDVQQSERLEWYSAVQQLVVSLNRWQEACIVAHTSPGDVPKRQSKGTFTHQPHLTTGMLVDSLGTYCCRHSVHIDNQNTVQGELCTQASRISGCRCRGMGNADRGCKSNTYFCQCSFRCRCYA